MSDHVLSLLRLLWLLRLMLGDRRHGKRTPGSTKCKLGSFTELRHFECCRVKWSKSKIELSLMLLKQRCMDKNWVWSCRDQIDVWRTVGMQKICEEERRNN